MATDTAGRWDALVIGSGIGGLAAAAALAEGGRRVLVLERHTQPGGLTQGFEREGFHFNVGVHYLGGFGEGQVNRRLFDRLSGGRIPVTPIPGVYDRVHFPDFSIAFAPPREALRQTLQAAFPREAANIDRYLRAVDEAARALGDAFMVRCAPGWLARPLAWLKRGGIARWVGRTTWEIVQSLIGDPRLQAVLCAQWGDYGSRPVESSFALHAAIVSHYLDGAWYPVGGSGGFAREFGATIAAHGGQVRSAAEVTAIRVDGGRVRGVTLANGEQVDCDCVISDAGLHNTLRLLPSPAIDYQWASDALELQPSAGHIGLYLGLEGNITAHGADTANTWIYDSWDVNRLWADPFSEARTPALFVSFPSLRDPAHDPGPRQRHTAEIVALVDWNAFAQWDASESPGGMKKHAPAAARSESYLAFKALIAQNLLAQFAEQFPDVAPLVKVHEVSTPISVATYTGAEHGALYGLHTSPQRFLSPALRPRTPIGGLFLAGQDASTPGVTGAFFGGLMAAASVDARLWKLLR